MEKRLANKKALITGGSSGIGQAIALAFAREGADVAITYLAQEKLAEDVVQKINALGQRGYALRSNLSREEDAAQLFERALDCLEEIDILVNNVGTLTRSSFLEIEPEQLRMVFQTNFFAPFVLAQRLCAWLINHERGGSIINVSSLSALRAVSRVAHYQSSKAALNMLTKSVAYEMAPFGIRVNTISPGLTRTPANRSQWETSPDLWAERTKHIPCGRAGLPEDHAGAAVYLASDEAAWVTGTNIVIDGGQSTA